MAQIFQFQNRQNGEEEYCCGACQTTDEYLEIALECEGEDELAVVLRSLYEDAYMDGREEFIKQDINVKENLLQNIHEDRFED